MIVWAIGYITTTSNKNQLLSLADLTIYEYIPQTMYRTKEQFEDEVCKPGEENDNARFPGYTNAQWPPCQYELTRVS